MKVFAKFSREKPLSQDLKIFQVLNQTELLYFFNLGKQ
ncbi:hypothetical protein PARA125_001283 [Parachlamydia sp. AcF125]|nr:hypothetical protein [Parachlamydia sp. AcF125]